MNLDKRDLDILIDNRVRERPETKKNVRISVMGYLLLVFGCILSLSVSLYWMAVPGAGVALIAVGMVKNSKTEKQLRKSLMEDYDRTGALPPYPEDKK